MGGSAIFTMNWQLRSWISENLSQLSMFFSVPFKYPVINSPTIFCFWLNFIRYLIRAALRYYGSHFSSSMRCCCIQDVVYMLLAGTFHGLYTIIMVTVTPIFTLSWTHLHLPIPICSFPGSSASVSNLTEYRIIYGTIVLYA